MFWNWRVGSRATWRPGFCGLVVLLVCAAGAWGQERGRKRGETIRLEDPLDKVQRLWKQGDLDGALKLGEDLLSQAGTSELHAGQTRLVLAYVRAQRATRGSGATANEDRRVALTLAQEAFDILSREKAAEAAPLAGDAGLLVGRLKREAGQEDEAATFLEGLADRQTLEAGKRVQAWTMAASARLALADDPGRARAPGGPAEAITAATRDLERALKLAEEHSLPPADRAPVHYALGLVHQRNHQAEEAARSFALAVAGAGDNRALAEPARAAHVGALLDLGRSEEAAREYEPLKTATTDPSTMLLEARLALAQGDPRAARSCLSRAEYVLKRKSGNGANDPEVARTLALLRAACEQAAGNFAAAEPIVSAELDRARAARAAPGVMAELHLNLGRLYLSLFRLAEARQQLDQALRILVETYGENHVQTQLARLELAAERREQAEFEPAAKLAGEAVARLTERLGPRHPSVVEGRLLYAAILAELPGRCADAMGEAQRAAADASTANLTMATEHYLRAGLLMAQCAAGAGRPDTSAASTKPATSSAPAPQLAEILSEARDRVARLAEAVPKTSPRLLAARLALADLSAQTPEGYAEALRLYDEVIAVLDQQRQLASCHPDVLKVRLGRAICLHRLGRAAEAADQATAALQECRDDVLNPQLALLWEVLASSRSASDPEQARAAYQKSYELMEKVYGPRHPKVAALVERMKVADSAR